MGLLVRILKAQLRHRSAKLAVVFEERLLVKSLSLLRLVLGIDIIYVIAGDRLGRSMVLLRGWPCSRLRCLKLPLSKELQLLLTDGHVATSLVGVPTASIPSTIAATIINLSRLSSS